MSDKGFVGVFAAVVLFVVALSTFLKSPTPNPNTPTPVTPTPVTGETGSGDMSDFGKQKTGSGVVYEKTSSNGTIFAVNEIVGDKNNRLYEVGTVQGGVFTPLATSTNSAVVFDTLSAAKSKVDDLASPSNTGPISEPQEEDEPLPPSNPADNLNPFPKGFGGGGF